MFFKKQKAIVVLIGVLLLLSIAPTAKAAANNENNLNFQAQYSINNQNLYVSVPPSLYNFYGNMSHTVYADSDYTNFVTPQAVEPIAENIQIITNHMPYSNEQFADAVLTLVHQIPYAVSSPKYPVETIVDNSGNCAALSTLAASIMEAGGLDVVLIDYTGINPHMNVGVYLPYTPVYHTAGMAPTDFVYDNKTYWTAETTDAADWKVGDQSSALASATPVIIPIYGTEQLSRAQVSASLNTPLLPSSITINLSQDQSSTDMSQQPIIEENMGALRISGSISPVFSGETVSIYVNSGSSNYYITTVTDDAGGYTVNWNFTSEGTYYITTSWSGASSYAGADSETLTVFVGPDSFVQFYGTYDTYTYLQANLEANEVQSLQGVNDFASIPLGTGVSFSYDFTILKAGQTIINVQTENITTPGGNQTLYLGKKPMMTMGIAPETAVIPVNVPADLEAFTLPDDFDQTINNQFCFILQNNRGDCSLNVNALDDYEMSSATAIVSNTAFMNASENVKENTWYHVTESISDHAITTKLFNTNGDLIQSDAAPYYTSTSSETIMLITNNVDSAVIFKDLTAQPLNNAIQSSKSNEKTTNESGSSSSYVSYTYPPTAQSHRTQGAGFWSSAALIAAILAIVGFAVIIPMTLMLRSRGKPEKPLEKKPMPHRSKSGIQSGQPPQEYSPPTSKSGQPPSEFNPSAWGTGYSQFSNSALQSSDRRYCPNCHRFVRENYRTCPYCNKRIR